MIKPLLIAIMLLLPAPLLAQDDTASLEGSWALEADGTAIFRFDLVDAGEEWHGTWLRPSSFGSDGQVFVQVTGPPVQLRSNAGLEFAGFVEISFNDPRPGAVPDIFRFTPQGKNQLEMTYVGTSLAPYRLVRMAARTPPGPWDAGKIYRVGKRTGEELPEPQARPSRINGDFLDGL